MRTPLRPERRRRSPLPLTAAAVAAAVVGVAIWQLAGSGSHPPAAAKAPAPAAKPKPHRPVAHHAAAVRTAPAPPRIVLAAARGDCWLSVHRGSAQGGVAYEGLLLQGRRLTFRGPRFWVRLGAPSVLSLTIDGKPQTLPAETGDVLVDARGVHPTS